MSKIIPEIYKTKLPKDILHPLKYTDIEKCFLEISIVDLTLKVFFSGYKNYYNYKKDRETNELAGNYRIVRFSNTPVARQIQRDVENPHIIWVSIYPVPQDVAKNCGLNRLIIRNIISKQIKEIMPNGLPYDRWFFSINLLEKAGMLECVSQVWDGIRPQPETTVMVSIN